jgi:hypothetical protein
MVEVPTSLWGRNQSGKTWRAFHLWATHPGPAIFCDIQGRRYGQGQTARNVEDVINLLGSSQGTTGPSTNKILWQLDNYDELDMLVDYLLTVHKKARDEGKSIRPVAIFMDEIWRAAGIGEKATNAAVRCFTEGLQHGVIAVSISQWMSQTSRLIGNQSYEYYFFALAPQDYAILRSNYHIDIPNTEWTAPRTYNYWKFVDGEWYRGNAYGVEVKHNVTRDEMRDVSEEGFGGEDESSVLPDGDETDSDRADLQTLSKFQPERLRSY